MFEIVDDKGRKYAVIADTVPIVLDMEHRSINASDLNMKFMACQNRIHDYEREAVR